MARCTPPEPDEQRHEREVEAHASQEDLPEPRRPHPDREKEPDLVCDKTPGERSEVGLMLGGMRDEEYGHHAPKHGEGAEDDET